MRDRPFSTFLICTPGEKRIMDWEFPPREAKPKPKPKPKAEKKPAGVSGGRCESVRRVAIASGERTLFFHPMGWQPVSRK